jgi:lantibiotic modifying enzyme
MVLALITPQQIEAESRLDVMSGTAGLLLSLLAYWPAEGIARTDRERAVDLACLCGRHLLNRRVWTSRGLAGWPGITHPPLSGFAHGAGGISYALARLFERTGVSEFRDAAIEGFAWERGLYDPQRKTWVDPRFGSPLHQAAWCHGAPGIALARLGCISAVQTPEIGNDISEALSITLRLPDFERDHLCCGNFGRVEILSVAATMTGRSDLTSAALALADRVLNRAEVRGFCFEARHNSDGRAESEYYDPSLFLGLSGVGYILLRLLFPDVLPGVLLLG